MVFLSVGLPVLAHKQRWFAPTNQSLGSTGGLGCCLSKSAQALIFALKAQTIAHIQTTDRIITKQIKNQFIVFLLDGCS